MKQKQQSLLLQKGQFQKKDNGFYQVRQTEEVSLLKDVDKEMFMDFVSEILVELSGIRTIENGQIGSKKVMSKYMKTISKQTMNETMNFDVNGIPTNLIRLVIYNNKADDWGDDKDDLLNDDKEYEQPTIDEQLMVNEVNGFCAENDFVTNFQQVDKATMNNFYSLAKDSLSFSSSELLKNYLDTFKQWTTCHNYQIIFDSDLSGWDSTTFHETLMKKKNTMIICTTTDGVVFGSFLNKQITQKDRWIHDDDYFIFFLNTPNKSLKTPVRYFRNGKNWAGEPFNGCFEIGSSYFVSFFSIMIEHECASDGCKPCFYNEYTCKLFKDIDVKYFGGYKHSENFQVNKLLALQWE
ncbi:TLDc domain-containing protein [Entamoeba marina]